MKKTFSYIAFFALLAVHSVSAAEYSSPSVEPRAAGAEVSRLLADAMPDEAVAALSKSLPPTPETQFAFEQLTSAFKLISKNGRADFEGEVKNIEYGKSVFVIIDYLHFPHQDVPVNQFLFLRYTFMNTGGGWVMSNFDFKTSGIFPPPGWSN